VSARGEQHDQPAKKVREAKTKPLISPTKTFTQQTAKQASSTHQPLNLSQYHGMINGGGHEGLIVKEEAESKS
jgi:hypothetical protein